MGCSSCSSGADGSPRGCKNKGRCGTCGTGGKTTYDWLEGIALPSGVSLFDIVEVRFKNNRKGFFRRRSTDSYYVGDVVSIDLNPGVDLGVVSLTGELVRTQMSLKKVRDDHEIKHIIHKSSSEEIEVWHRARLREDSTRLKAREIIKRLNINMKLSDVELQGDDKKATFYYIAEQRVDFRELVRELASTFNLRIDMRQIGARQEAARVGGIGSCGRELCCSTWLTDFRSVSTGAARYQQLALNPVKLAGQCGKLKCCLNFELDQYVEAVNEFPSPNTKIRTSKGNVVIFKMDIFKKIVYFLELGETSGGPQPVSLAEANKLIKAANDGENIGSIAQFAIQEIPDEVSKTYSNVVGQDDLTRFDHKKNQGNRKPKGNNKKRPQNRHRGEKKVKPQKSNS
jgi:cell fate regulator YaaT (PSP1 superfamily)